MISELTVVIGNAVLHLGALRIHTVDGILKLGFEWFN